MFVLGNDIDSDVKSVSQVEKREKQQKKGSRSFTSKVPSYFSFL